MLIHEAYSLDQDHGLAVAAAHATAGDAARVAAQAGVDELVITHITNPFHEDTQPLIDEARQHFQGPISSAFDLRQITVDS
jgi:ribonuclease Z